MKEPSSIFEKLFFTTVRIATLNKNTYKREVGTGFFIRKQLKDDLSLVYLVTAKHVIDDMSDCVIFMHATKEGKLDLGNPMRIELDKFGNDWIKHERFDVAILSIGPILNELKEKNTEPFLLFIDLDYSPVQEEIDEYIDGVEDVYFIGYPDDKYDKVNMIPIMRKGITATPYNINYNGESKFVIDASIYEGTSGSPILICNPDNFSLKGKGLHAGTRLFFLGLISRAYRRMEDEEYINLGICCKSSIIYELIEQHAKKHNFELEPRRKICIPGLS
ncbi:MAG: trypsin-like peptidase domain-containing protein [Ignavibacteria bacterium]|nr:trypsin-like peptidase domain-containing protein [Ignavibacteria bacterium]